MARVVAFFTGIYYALTGVWALVDIRSFQMVTGPKTDLWLVKTVGALILVVGVTYLACFARREIPRVISLLGMGMAVALFLVDVTYTFDGTISPIYLADAFVEIFIALGWIATLLFSDDKEKGSRLHRLPLSGGGVQP